MPEYRFTPEARDDLQNIINYTCAPWGKARADKYVDGLEQRAAQLAAKPHLGVNRNTLIRGLISFRPVSHVLYYVRQPHGITIIRVLHKSMDAKQHL